MSIPFSKSIVVHYHEVGLKGRNRNFFERLLARNCRSALRGTGYSKVRNISGRVLVDLQTGADEQEALGRLSRIFGIQYCAPALKITNPSMSDIEEAALRTANELEFATFAVRAKKGHSSFETSSQRINEIVGQVLKDTTGKPVDLSNPEFTCHIELVEDLALIWHKRTQGPGGLPTGSSGRILTLFSGGIDSPVAAWEVAKRGATSSLIHFHGQPFADRSSVRQCRELAQILARWQLSANLWVVPFGDIQREVAVGTPTPLRIVLYRRFMMRISEALAIREGLQALVTGESLGQVASQTIENLRVIGEPVNHLPVLRPLIGRDKQEIIHIAKAIETYEISSTPYQDCCVLFAAREVATRASLQALRSAEENLDVAGLVDKATAAAELETFEYPP